MSTVTGGPQIVRTGLILDLDAGYMRSYSPNVYPNPTDLLATQYMGNEIQSCTVSRDTTITRQYGSIPMKMVITGNDAYAGRYGYLAANLASALSGQTWTISVWAKASVATDGQLFIFGADTNGAWSVTPDYSAGTIAITTSWQRFSFSYTFTNANTRYIQFRLDGTNTGGSGITIWWDLLQVERASSATTFNPYYFGNTVWKDISGGGYNGTLTSGSLFNTSNYGNILFDGSDDYVIGNTPSGLNLSQPCTVNVWVYFNNFNVINPRIIEVQDSSYSIQIIRDGASTRLATKNSNFQSGTNSTTWFVPSTSIWYNISVVWDPYASSTTLYLNSVLQSSVGSTPVGAGNQTNKYVIGRRSDFVATTELNGNVAQVSIYNRALTAAEVSQNYEATKTRFGL